MPKSSLKDNYRETTRLVQTGKDELQRRFTLPGSEFS